MVKGIGVDICNFDDAANRHFVEPLAKLSTGKRSKLIKAPDKPVF
jgi:hypothetical protein